MIDTDNWIAAVSALRKAKHVVVFTGAGISAESGIPTFRDAGGFWKRFPPEKYANWSGLLKLAVTQPRSVAEFVLNVIEPAALASPNAAHQAVAQLEARTRTSVITQNIDGLHQTAGSTNVLEIHGSLLEVIHSSSRQIVHRFERRELAEIANALRKYVNEEQSLMRLAMELRQLYPLDWLGFHRPNLVLFGDAMAKPAWTTASQAALDCDLLLAIGTSGTVEPAARLPFRAQNAGATVIFIDPKPCFGCWLEGEAGTVLPKLIKDAFEATPKREGSGNYD